MRLKVLSFLMGYNGHVYRAGDYVEVITPKEVEMMVREHCVEPPKAKAINEVTRGGDVKKLEGKDVKNTIPKGGARRPNGKHTKL